MGSDRRALRPRGDREHCGRTTILVGDGISDRYAAEAAALVFARRLLADLCRELGIPCVEFGTLGEVEAELRRMTGGDLIARPVSCVTERTIPTVRVVARAVLGEPDA